MNESSKKSRGDLAAAGRRKLEEFRRKKDAKQAKQQEAKPLDKDSSAGSLQVYEAGTGDALPIHEHIAGTAMGGVVPAVDTFVADRPYAGDKLDSSSNCDRVQSGDVSTPVVAEQSSHGHKSGVDLPARSVPELGNSAPAPSNDLGSSRLSGSTSHAAGNLDASSTAETPEGTAEAPGMFAGFNAYMSLANSITQDPSIKTTNLQACASKPAQGNVVKPPVTSIPTLPKSLALPPPPPAPSTGIKSHSSTANSANELEDTASAQSTVAARVGADRLASAAQIGKSLQLETSALLAPPLPDLPPPPPAPGYRRFGGGTLAAPLSAASPSSLPASHNDLPLTFPRLPVAHPATAQDVTDQTSTSPAAGGSPQAYPGFPAESATLSSIQALSSTQAPSSTLAPSSTTAPSSTQTPGTPPPKSSGSIFSAMRPSWLGGRPASPVHPLASTPAPASNSNPHAGSHLDPSSQVTTSGESTPAPPATPGITAAPSATTLPLPENKKLEPPTSPPVAHPWSRPNTPQASPPAFHASTTFLPPPTSPPRSITTGHASGERERDVSLRSHSSTAARGQGSSRPRAPPISAQLPSSPAPSWGAPSSAAGDSLPPYSRKFFSSTTPQGLETSGPQAGRTPALNPGVSTSQPPAASTQSPWQPPLPGHTGVFFNQASAWKHPNEPCSTAPSVTWKQLGDPSITLSSITDTTGASALPFSLTTCQNGASAGRNGAPTVLLPPPSMDSRYQDVTSSPYLPQVLGQNPSWLRPTGPSIPNPSSCVPHADASHLPPTALLSSATGLSSSAVGPSSLPYPHSPMLPLSTTSVFPTSSHLFPSDTTSSLHTTSVPPSISSLLDSNSALSPPASISSVDAMPPSAATTTLSTVGSPVSTIFAVAGPGSTFPTAGGPGSTFSASAGPGSVSTHHADHTATAAPLDQHAHSSEEAGSREEQRRAMGRSSNSWQHGLPPSGMSSQAQQQIKALQQHVEELMEDKMELSRGLTQHGRLNEALADENSALMERYNATGKALEDAQNKLKRYEAEIEAQKMALNTMCSERDTARLLLKDAQDRASTLAAEVVNLEKELLQAKSSKLLLEKQRTEYGTQIHSQQKQVHRAAQDVAHLQSLLEASQEEVRILGARLRELEASRNSEPQPPSTPTRVAPQPSLFAPVGEPEAERRAALVGSSTVPVPCSTQDQAVQHCSDDLLPLPTSFSATTQTDPSSLPAMPAGDMTATGDAANTAEQLLPSSSLIADPPLLEPPVDLLLGQLSELLPGLDHTQLGNAQSKAAEAAQEESRAIAAVFDMLQALEDAQAQLKAELAATKAQNQQLQQHNAALSSKLASQQQHMELVLQQQSNSSATAAITAAAPPAPLQRPPNSTSNMWVLNYFDHSKEQRMRKALLT